MGTFRLILVALALFVLILLPIEQASSLGEYEGWLSAYDQEPTMDTIYYRLGNGDIQLGFDVYIAVPNCKRIGETGTMIIGDSKPLTYQVFDCSGDEATNDWMNGNNIIAEIDFWAWQKYGLGRAVITPHGEATPQEVPSEPLPKIEEVNAEIYLGQALEAVEVDDKE